MIEPKLPPVGDNFQQWARRLNQALSLYFVRNPAAKIEFNTFDQVATNEGTLTWNIAENTLNIGHGSGVVQQVGLESYLRAENVTGSTIVNGAVVALSGAADEMQIDLYIADSSVDPYSLLGVATQDILTGTTGMVSVFGKVRDIDTSAWTAGDILYASPVTAGALTSTRPTAPDDIAIVATVIKSDAVAGEILVRPEKPIGLDYAAYASTVDQTPAAINTAYPVTFNSTVVEHKISLVSGSRVTFDDSGVYILTIKLQVTSTNASSSTVYTWLRKNGVDIDSTRVDLTVKANGDTLPLNNQYQILVTANDYFEVMWAADSTSITLDAKPALAFAPSAPSARIVVSQIQL